jgi:Zn-dependent metalloprotease
VNIFNPAACLALVGAGLAAVTLTQASAAPDAPAVQNAPAAGGSLVRQMKARADGSVAVSAERSTGRVGFIRVAGTGDLSPVVTARTAFGAANKASDYLADFAPAFGATPAQLHQTSVQSSSDGTTVTFEQVYRGVPVFGSMLRAQIDPQGDLTSVNGYAAPGVDLSVTPRLSAGQAAARAIRAVRADPPSHNKGLASTAGIRAASTDLVVYRTGATRGVVGDNVLAYVVEVTNRSNIRDMVFVDANAGKLLNRYSVMDDALNRHVFERRFTPAAEVWGEGDPFPGALNANQERIVRGSGEAYWLFRNAFGRDSYDAKGHRMNTVNNDPTIACPNANWNGTTTNYCNGVTSDDTVAHEWAHAYTEFTSNLIYQYQSGALNESYSDIWGETVDMVNGRQDQTPDTIRPANLCSTQTRGEVRLDINSPANIAGPCKAAPAAFGPIIDQNGVTNDVVVGRDARGPGGDTPTNGCSPFTNAGAIAGIFVYVDRGLCPFQVKVDNASAAGAQGIIVGDNVRGEAPFQITGQSDIYGVMIGLANGEKIKSAPAGTVNVTIRDISTAARVDSFRWLSGEGDTAFGGAIRDMWSPTCYGDPAKVADVEYQCSTDDNGGVHTNSGVPNHTFALLVDGGTFNGVHVRGIGLDKAANIFWRAQSAYLTPTSDFADFADSLDAACSDKIGDRIRAMSTAPRTPGAVVAPVRSADCTSVTRAEAAVQLRRAPTQCNFKPMFRKNPPALCGAGTKTRTIFAENFEDGLADWGRASEIVFPGATGAPWRADTTLPKGRPGTAAFGPAPDRGDCALGAQDFSSRNSIISPAISIPLGKAVARKLSFKQYVATELGFDGGNVKYRTGKRWKTIPSSAFTFNKPTRLATAADGNTNPMAGQVAFTGTDGGEVTGSWGQSQVNLSALRLGPGSRFRLRFDMGRDGCGGIDGWYLDDIRVTVCVKGAARPAGIVTGRRN